MKYRVLHLKFSLLASDLFHEIVSKYNNCEEGFVVVVVCCLHSPISYWIAGGRKTLSRDRAVSIA